MATNISIYIYVIIYVLGIMEKKPLKLLNCIRVQRGF